MNGSDKLNTLRANTQRRTKPLFQVNDDNKLDWSRWQTGHRLRTDQRPITSRRWRRGGGDDDAGIREVSGPRQEALPRLRVWDEWLDALLTVAPAR